MRSLPLQRHRQVSAECLPHSIQMDPQMRRPAVKLATHSALQPCSYLNGAHKKFSQKRVFLEAGTKQADNEAKNRSAWPRKKDQTKSRTHGQNGQKSGKSPCYKDQTRGMYFLTRNGDSWPATKILLTSIEGSIWFSQQFEKLSNPMPTTRSAIGSYIMEEVVDKRRHRVLLFRREAQLICDSQRRRLDCFAASLHPLKHNIQHLS